MLEEFSATEKIKGLIGLIVILGLGYYAYPYDDWSVLFGVITIVLIARLVWWSKMQGEAYRALELICLEGNALIIQERYKHQILNPDLYSEIPTYPINEDLYFEIETDDYLIVPNRTIENNDMEILDHGIYSKAHDIWIARGCLTSPVEGPSDKTSYWLCDKDLTLMMPIYVGGNKINIKKYLNMHIWMSDEKLFFYNNFKKSAKRENYY